MKTVDLKTKAYGRFYLLYGGIVVVLLCGLALLQWINVAYISTAYYVAFALALCLGTAHLKVMQWLLNVFSEDYFVRGLGLTAALPVISVVLIIVIYFIRPIDLNFISFLPVFLLPYLIYCAYNSYLHIPESKYRLSAYPFDRQFPDISQIDFSETFVIDIVLKKKPESLKQTSFTAMAPRHMPVSELFFTFIYEYNKNNPESYIQFISGNNEPYQWLLFVKKGLLQQKEFLDPEFSFEKNNIAANQRIYAIRKSGE